MAKQPSKAAAAKAAAAASVTSSSSAAPSASESEISEGAQRLAEELRPYVPQNALPDSAGVPDLQLAICRKLREVC